MMKYALIFIVLTLLTVGCKSNKNALEQTSVTRGAVAEVSLGTGETVYNNHCAMCHGKEGQGGVGEELADNRDLADTSHVIRRIVKGNAPMPPFNYLSDEEVASVASYIRSTWGNDFGEVSAAQVQEQR